MPDLRGEGAASECGGGGVNEPIKGVPTDSWTAAVADAWIAIENRTGTKPADTVRTVFFAGGSVAVDVAASDYRALLAENERLRRTVRNIRLCAATARVFGHQATPQTDVAMILRKNDGLDNIIEFCALAGEPMSILRSGDSVKRELASQDAAEAQEPEREGERR